MGLVQGGRTRVSDGDEDYMRKKRPWNVSGVGWLLLVQSSCFLMPLGVCFGNTEECNGFNSWREGCGY